MWRPDRPDLHLGSRHRAPAFGGIGFVGHRGGVDRHAARLLERDEHVHRAVLQDLEVADRAAELLSLLEVVERQRVHPLHDADGFGAEGRDGGVDGTLGGGQAIGGVAQRFAARVGERDLGRARAVLRRVAAAGDARVGGVDEEKADAATVALAAGCARGDDEVVRRVAAEHEALLAVDAIRAAVGAGCGGNVGEVVPRGLFEVREGQDGFARDDLRDEFCALRGARRRAEHAAREHDGRTDMVRGRGRGPSPP